MGLYALIEGLFVGGFSYMVENYYLGETDGVVLQALAGTIAVFLTMLAVYKFGIIKPTEKFVLVVCSLVGAIMIVYVFNFILMLFQETQPLLFIIRIHHFLLLTPYILLLTFGQPQPHPSRVLRVMLDAGDVRLEIQDVLLDFISNFINKTV